MQSTIKGSHLIKMSHSGRPIPALTILRVQDGMFVWRPDRVLESGRLRNEEIAFARRVHP